MADKGKESLISRRKKYMRCVSNVQDELKSFRSYLRWMCVDQSKVWTACLSWFMFILFAIAVPAASHFFLACSICDSRHSRPFDGVLQLSLSSMATLSFVCLSTIIRKYGLRRFLFFDKLCDESETVRNNYTKQLNNSLKIHSFFVIPCFVAEGAYKIWWYSSGASQIPFLGNLYVSDAVLCFMELCSWLYRTTVIFVICVLLHLICHLQILRLQDFAKMFSVDSDVGSILCEHLRIKRHLRIISHRFRAFILWSLILITGSQFASLLSTTKPSAHVDVFTAGELALCSMTLVVALCIILRSAAKITHKAQAITSLAAKWHVCATLDSLDAIDEVEGHEFPASSGTGPSDQEEANEEGDDIDNTELMHSYAYSTISFHKRQALVTYFENNKAGITVFGFMLDRTTLNTIFGFELSLVLWLLGKTIGIS